MSKLSIGLKITWKIIKLIFVLCVFAVIAVLIWRIASSGEPKEMKTVYPTASLVELYEQDGKELYMFEQEQRDITSGENNYGYFSVTSYRIIPDIDQIEIVVRYNVSTIKNVASDYSLDEVPPRDADMFDVSLVFAKDLTPEREDDNLGNAEGSVEFIRCFGETVCETEKNLYNYKKMIFRTDEAGIDLSDMLEDNTLLAVYTDFYLDYAEFEPNYDEQPIGAVCLYDYKTKDKQIKLSSRDIKAIESFSD